MTPQQAAQLLNSPILKAYSEGKKIDLKLVDGTWTTLEESAMTFRTFEDIAENPHNYRIKPGPREFWVLVNKYSQVIDSNMHKSQEKAEAYAQDLFDYPEQWIPMHVKEILPS